VTEPKAPSFNGVEIRVGDKVEMPIGWVRGIATHSGPSILVQYPSGFSVWTRLSDVGVLSDRFGSAPSAIQGRVGA
jgi:hypothetical protein